MRPPRLLLRVTWVAFVLVAGLAGLACGVEVPATEDGPRLFAAMCARCHRADGHGSLELRTPDMTTAAWQAAHPPDVVRATIVDGSKSKKMPGFGATTFTPRQLEALTAHVKSFGPTVPGAAP